jgi:hypothetical protein
MLAKVISLSVVPDPATEIELIVDKPQQPNSTLSRVGELGELEGITRQRLYLKVVTGL